MFTLKIKILLLEIIQTILSSQCFYPTNISAVSTGQKHTCILNQGEAYCLGQDTNSESTVPTDLTDFTFITAGGSHTCGTLRFGLTECWGLATSGQTTVPTDFNEGAIDIAAGSDHTCGVRYNGAVTCWGSNTQGQTTVPSDLDTEAQAVWAGLRTSCGLTSTRMLVCWGSNSNGQTDVPGVPSGPGGFYSGTVDAAAGDQHTCGVMSSNAVDCWGSDSQGQVTTPGAVASGATKVAAGARHSCAIYSSALLCWGSDADNQSSLPTAFAVGGTYANDVSLVSAALYQTCGVSSSGSLGCWGLDDQNQLAVGCIACKTGQTLVENRTKCVDGVIQNCTLLTNDSTSLVFNCHTCIAGYYALPNSGYCLQIVQFTSQYTQVLIALVVFIIFLIQWKHWYDTCIPLMIIDSIKQRNANSNDTWVKCTECDKWILEEQPITEFVECAHFQHNECLGIEGESIEIQECPKCLVKVE